MRHSQSTRTYTDSRKESFFSQIFRLSQSKKKEKGRRRRGEEILIIILTGKKKPHELVQLDLDKQCVFKKSVLPRTVCG